MAIAWTRVTFLWLLVYAELPFAHGYFSPWYRDYYPQPIHYCAYGCKALAPYITFNVPVPENFDVGQCTDNIKLESLYHCAQAYCSPEEYREGMDYLSRECVRNAGVSLPSAEDMALVEEELAAVQRLDVTTGLASATVPLESPAIPNAEWHALAERTVSAYYYNWNIGFTYSWSFYGFWGLVILVGLVNRLLRSSLAASERRSNSKFWLWLRRNVILAPTFSKHCQEPRGWCTIPPRLETITLVLYIVMNIVMCFPGYRTFLGNQYYPATNVQIARYVSDRTGFMAIGQLPIIFIFAMRNDPLLWLTGWTYATYNRFHRWVARLAVALAIVHSIGFSIFSTYAKTWTLSWSEQYWYSGVIATITMSLTLGISLYYFRRNYYDFFLVCHICLAVIVLVCVYLHVEPYRGEFEGFIWPCVAIWAFDRLLRLGRVMGYGIFPRFLCGAKAIVMYDRKAEMIRMDVTCLLRSERIIPGHIYYVYLPGLLRGYESHPFTLCSWRRVEDVSEQTMTFDEDKKSTESKRSNDDAPCTSHTTRHTFLIRSYPGNGFTGRLQKLLTSSTTPEDPYPAPKPLTVFLEGPYRPRLDLSPFTDALFILGGSGLTTAISHAHYLLAPDNLFRTNVHIHWSVPQAAFVEDVLNHELAAVISHHRFALTVYIAGEEEEEQGKAVREEAQRRGSALRVVHGRMDVEAVVRVRREVCEGDGGLAVVNCGTRGMGDAVRQGIRNVLKQEGPAVEWFDEGLMW